MRPWWNDPTVAQLTFLDHGVVPSSPIIRVWLAEIKARGFVSVRTGAVTDAGTDSLHRQGFATLQTLSLLDLSLIGWRPPVLRDGLPIRSRRLWVRDRPTAATVDLAAFTANWAIDTDGIDETCSATPSHRARTVEASAADPHGSPGSPGSPGTHGPPGTHGSPGTHGPPPVRLAGYAITGRADHHGYLQRLAVHPDYQGLGVGLSLTLDSLVWMQRRRLTRAVVNTHTDNEVALGVYQRVGFRILPRGLSVLVRRLDDL